MSEEFEKICALALGTAFGYEPVLSRKLTDELGSASAVFALTEEERAGLLSSLPQYRGALDDRRLQEAEKELKNLGMIGCDFVPLCSEAYPSLLRECPDAPAGLYYRGTSPPETVLNPKVPLAVVGTRDCSAYGHSCCEKAVQALACCKPAPCIVSGLAYGIDVVAHITALDNGLPTIAVLPCGIDTVYPARHSRVARHIAEAPHSALVTDYPPLTAPLAHHFLRRNRLIAGMSRATLLVESRRRGGGMSTARLACGYGRELYTIPGRVDDVRSQGPNSLIACQMAQALERPDDWAHALGLCGSRARQEKVSDAARRFYGGDDDAEQLSALLAAVEAERGVGLDDLCRRLDLPFGRVSALAMRLEGDGFLATDLLQRCSISAKY
jgi:DNA processing protein